MPDHHWYNTDRRNQPIEQVYPIGSVWKHPSMPHAPVTVIGIDGDHVEVDWLGRTAELNSKWPRGALDLSTTVLVSPPDTLPQEAPMSTTYDPHRAYRIGDRVQVTDIRTTIGSHPLGSGGSEYVGKTATVEGADYHDSVILKFDDTTLDNFGTWSHAALDLLVEVEATDDTLKVGDKVRILEADFTKVGGTGTLTSMTDPWTSAHDRVHPYIVQRDSDNTLIHCITVEKIEDEASDDLDPDNLTGMDLGDGVDEVDGPMETSPNRPIVAGDRVRFRKTSWKSGGKSNDVGQAVGIRPGSEGTVIAVADYSAGYPEGEATNFDIEWDVEGSRKSQSIHVSWIDPLDNNEEARLTRLLEHQKQRVVDAEARTEAKQRELDAVSTALLEQQQTNEDLRNERNTLTQAASDERRRLTDEIDTNKAAAAIVLADLARTKATLDYALDMLPTSAAIKVSGFVDGYRGAQA